MRLGIPLLSLLLIAPQPLWAQTPKKSRRPKSRSASELVQSVQKFLRRTNQVKTTTAVAAIRGGRPSKLAVDLEKKLSTKAALLRRNLLTDAPPAGAETSLRRIYRALSASYLAKSAAIGESDEVRDRASSAIQDMAPALTQDGLPAGSLKALTGKAEELMNSGWGTYVEGLASKTAVKVSARTAVGSAKPKTAELDEQLASILTACQEKKLDKEDLSEGIFLAGLLLRGLSEADYGEEAAQEDVSLPPDDEAQAGAGALLDVPFVPKRIYLKASPAVVLIVCSSPDGTGELGSGSVIDKNGKILTNAHVVIRDSTRKPWESIRVYLKPQSMTGNPDQDLKNPLPARVASSNRALDLALLELEGPLPPLAALALGQPKSMTTGDQVAAIGHPEEGGLWTLTTGVISGPIADLGGVRGRSAFQTDTGINRGNSGGPLLNAAGDIIGVNTSMSRTAADGMAITSVNFAVRSDVAKRWLAKAGMNLAYSSPAPIELPAPQAPPVLRDSSEGGGLSGVGGLGGGLRSFSPGAADSAEMEPAPRKKKEVAFPSEAAEDKGFSMRMEHSRSKAKIGTLLQGFAEPAASGPDERDGVVTESKPFSIDALLGKKLRGGAR